MNSSKFIHSKERKRLEKHIDEFIPKFLGVFESNQDAIFIVDTAGFLVKTNIAGRRLLQHSNEELRNLTLEQLTPEKFQLNTYQGFTHSLKGEFQNFDSSLLQKNGKCVNLNFSTIPLQVDQAILGACFVAKEISHLKVERNAKIQEDEIFRILTEHSLDIVLRTNVIGLILYISPACEKLLGYTPQELIGTNASVIFHPEDAESIKLGRLEICKRKENGRDFYRMIRKDGSVLMVEALCKPILDANTQQVTEVISTIRDISSMKLAESKLKNREETYRNLIDYSPDAVIVLNENHINFINETGMRLLGASTKEEMYTKSIYDFVHPDYIELALKRIKLVKEGRATEFTEYKLLRLDGTIIEVEIMGIPTIYENKPANHIIVRSIEERKKTQELIINSEKLATAGKLAAGIAHEVRNPLTAIKGFHQLMKTESSLESNQKYLDIINSEVDRIELILNELLVLSRPQELKVDQVDLVSLIRDVRTLLDPEAIMKGINIEDLYDHNTLIVHADKNQLKQVFINVLKNSIEALEKNGNILIELRDHGPKKVKLLFKDNGCGIPQHLLSRIGEPFFTTKENGTGLGIMISKQIIQNHHGDFHIWSDHDGTIIEILLPIPL
ncbi:PAS domain-containing protein [Bacillus pinisoli]|uniref:PAS domain-containing protein n=1 Tax=Bacillus pinisoli TaxID=2901866 RepID=UPI001FF5B5F7|nr:PAS domain S-box protein [Bacillus pinisoli]